MNHRIATILALISVIVIVALAPAIAASPIISIDSYTIGVDSDVTVPIEITNAGAVAGGSVKIIFDPAIVNVQEVLSGDFGVPVVNINNTAGFVSIAKSSHVAVGEDHAELASVRFKGVSKGITMLDIQDADLNDETGVPITPAPETSDGEINVRASSDSDTDSDTDSTTSAATDDDPEKETFEVSSNEPTAINIGSYTVGVDSNVTVPVEITHASAVAGGSLNISFNPLFVNVEEVLPGDFGIPIANINNDAGFVYIACASPTAVGKDKAKLAGVRFRGVSKGITSLDIQDAALNDENGNLITLETASGGEIDVRTSISTLTPTPVAAANNESIATPPPAPGEHDSLFVITIIIVVCVALAGGAIALYRKRKK